jgi:hypothetical protein
VAEDAGIVPVVVLGLAREIVADEADIIVVGKPEVKVPSPLPQPFPGRPEVEGDRVPVVVVVLPGDRSLLQGRIRRREQLLYLDCVIITYSLNQQALVTIFLGLLKVLFLIYIFAYGSLYRIDSATVGAGRWTCLGGDVTYRHQRS